MSSPRTIGSKVSVMPMSVAFALLQLHDCSIALGLLLVPQLLCSADLHCGITQLDVLQRIQISGALVQTSPLTCQRSCSSLRR